MKQCIFRQPEKRQDIILVVLINWRKHKHKCCKGLEERIEPIDYFDESVWKLTVEKVTIFHDGRMIFQFVDGTEIEG